MEEPREVITDLKFELNPVTKRGIERAFHGNRNAPPGFYIIFNDDTALLISSDPYLQRNKITGEERVLANHYLS